MSLIDVNCEKPIFGRTWLKIVVLGSSKEKNPILSKYIVLNIGSIRICILMTGRLEVVPNETN